MVEEKCKHDGDYVSKAMIGYTDIFCKECGEEMCECADFDEIHKMEEHRFDHDW